MGEVQGRPQHPANVLVAEQEVEEEEEEEGEPDEEPTGGVGLPEWLNDLKEKWLYTTQEGNLEDSAEGIRLSLQFRQTAQEFHDCFVHWQIVRSATLHALRDMITNLEGKSRVVDIANLSGSVGGAVGGTLTVAGLALIPFTFGASVALTVSGLGLSVVGAVTSGGALITNITVDVNSRKDFDNLIAIDCSATARMQDRLRELQDVAAQFTTWTSRSPGFVVTDKVMHTLRATKSLVGCGRGINSGIKNVCMASKVACAATESAKEGVRLSKTGVAGAKAASTFAGAAVESATEGVTLCKTGDIGAKLASAGVKTVSKATMGLAAVGVAADIAMIAYFSHRIYTGSKSSRAAEIRRIRRLLKGELSTLQDVHNTLVEH